MWIPTGSLSTLRLRLLDPNSRFFQISDSSWRALVQTIGFTISEVPVQNEVTRSLTDPSSFQLSQNRFFTLNAWFARAFNGTVT
jgi:hypothetical protein